jgi:hypothetical protein
MRREDLAPATSGGANVTKLATVLDGLVKDAPIDRCSWDNVVARARRKTRRRVALATAVAALIAIVLATPALGLGNRLMGIFDGTPVASTQVPASDLHVLSAMAHGVSPRLPASKQEDATRFQAASLRQLAVRDGRAFFAARAEGGGMCVAIGEIGAEDLFGSISCAPGFPSSARPLLDESAWSGPGLDRQSEAQPRVSLFEGFAADGVASVGLLVADGKIAAVTRVEDNVYLRRDGLPGEPVLGIVALDNDKQVINIACMAQGGCPAPK